MIMQSDNASKPLAVLPVPFKCREIAEAAQTIWRILVQCLKTSLCNKSVVLFICPRPPLLSPIEFLWLQSWQNLSLYSCLKFKPGLETRSAESWLWCINQQHYTGSMVPADVVTHDGTTMAVNIKGILDLRENSFVWGTLFFFLFWQFGLTWLHTLAMRDQPG